MKCIKIIRSWYFYRSVFSTTGRLANERKSTYTSLDLDI